jgi:hypothetical protein
MNTKATFDKIETFVQEQINRQSSIIIREIAQGFKVNNCKVLQKNNQWTILNSIGIEVNKLNSQRLAVLSAASICKKRFSNINVINALDIQLQQLKHDKKWFEMQINRSINKEVLEDRLGRVIDELETVYFQISQLEKSIGLQ